MTTALNSLSSNFWVEKDSAMMVEWWYDRSLSLWTCIWVDEEGNQVGAAQYTSNREDRKALVKLMEETEPTDCQI